jgi:hypothetical protein
VADDKGEGDSSQVNTAAVTPIDEDETAVIQEKSHGGVIMIQPARVLYGLMVTVS